MERVIKRIKKLYMNIIVDKKCYLDKLESRIIRNDTDLMMLIYDLNLSGNKITYGLSEINGESKATAE